MSDLLDTELLLNIQAIIGRGFPPKETLDDIVAMLDGRDRRVCRQARYIISINFDDPCEEADAYGDLVMAAHTISRNYRVTIDFAYDKTVEISEPQAPHSHCPRD
ncbi:MAG: hypothetical protein JO307_21030 [Bryobacterales bacterium]|nr:hypothetical protein [Bryobacterales bacterium]